jgi:hypothetical protein
MLMSIPSRRKMNIFSWTGNSYGMISLNIARSPTNGQPRIIFRTYELNAAELQTDVDWYNHHFESLNLTPKFTKGQLYHPYHPKRFIHDHIDKVIQAKRNQPDRFCTIKVSV